MANTSSTKPKAHSDRKHALLSASGSSRWLNCTPSARLEEEHGNKQETSVFAEEGTLAHELSEVYLRYDPLQILSQDEFNSQLENIMSNDIFDDEMLDEVPKYVAYCVEQFTAAKAKCKLAVMEVEQRLDFTEFVPESFGTADCCIIADDVLEVVDLKYGKGVPVYAHWNRQLMLYSLGALRKYDVMYDIKEVKMTIVQPRIDNFSSFTFKVEELLKWAEEELKPKAELAFAGQGEICAGDWCKWCSIKNRCRKLCDTQLELAKYEFSAPELLEDEEIADILSRTPQLVNWANSIAEYALSEAVNHDKQWPGFKLVEGRSKRAWLSKDTVVTDVVEAIPEVCETELYEEKPKSLTAIEKIVGKKRFATDLGHLIIKSPGAPTLVSINDARPAISKQAKEDFK